MGLETLGPRQGLRGLTAWIGIVLALVLPVLLVAAYLVPPPHVEATLDPTKIAPEEGFAYILEIPLRLPLGYSVPTDGAGGPQSNLQLYENGPPLGPAHSWHIDIRQAGAGRYSDWNGWLRFSASDNSDPRTNGRRYSVSAIASVHPFAFPAVLLFDLIVLFATRERLKAAPRFREACAHVLLGMAVLLAAAAAIGALRKFGDSPPQDVALVTDTLMHALLGCVIAATQWVVGAGLARLALRQRDASVPDVLLLGFVLSLPAAALFSAIALFVPYGLMLATALAAACCQPLFSWRPLAKDLRDIARVVAATLPFAIGFGCWLGLLWHGPTATLAGTPPGDLVYYSTSIVSLATHPYPYLNFGYEREPLNIYFNMLFPALGAALSRALSFDPFLYISAAGAAFFVISLSVSLRLYVTGREVHQRPHATLACTTLALAVLAAIRYPSWAVESIPMIYVVPLTLAVVYWARKPGPAGQIFAVSAAVVGSALSKIVVVAVLAPFAASVLVKRFLEGSSRARIAAIAVGTVTAIYSAIMLYRLGPFYFSLSEFGPYSLYFMRISSAGPVGYLPFVMRDIAAVAIIIGAFLLTDWLTAAAIAFGCVLFLGYAFLFFVDFTCAALLFGLVACESPDRLQRHRFLALGTLVLALPATLMTDPGGMQAAAAWLIVIGGAVWIALSPGNMLAWSSHGRTATASVLILCFALLAVGRGNLIASPGASYAAPELTPAVREIWLTVRKLTPQDALIFTDQTDIEPNLLGGWNTYTFLGARQIFLSNLYATPSLRSNRDLSLQVLQENESVLSGEVAPTDVPLREKYSSYFAVVSRDRPVPKTWTEIFENDRYALYRVEPVD